eukprot:3210896-Amphidinium_carterae.1
MPSVGIGEQRTREGTICAMTRAIASPVAIGNHPLMSPNSRLVASGFLESTEQFGLGNLGGIGSGEK